MNQDTIPRADGSIGIDVHATGREAQRITVLAIIRFVAPVILDRLVHKVKTICHGVTSCPNGGTCSSPNACVCAPGFGGSQCSDINECQTGTDNCQQNCINTHGSFTCSCESGHTMNSDGATCTDINECQTGTDNCQHNCINTHGSFTCSCESGYTMNSDGATCTDIDECLENNGGCSEYCKNLNGSYECYCKEGLHLANDRKTCIDIDECSSNNGGCDQVCKNDHAVFRCECYQGFSLDDNGKSCNDNNECLGSNKCSQSCNNTIRSYVCSCDPEYHLESDGFTCTDIYDCFGIECFNNGRCVDFPGSYTCKCEEGFEGEHCELDINECLYLNGGCQDQCLNTNGSFQCQCRDNTVLEENGVSCRGDSNQPTIFQTYKIARRLLPRGCAFTTLMSCQEAGNGLEIKLSSTDSWYRLNTNMSIKYTYGIVFVEVDNFSIPVSLSGLIVVMKTGKFELITGSVQYQETDGTQMFDMHDDNCMFFSTTPKDIYDFVSSGSFLGTVFEGLKNKIPSWLQFSKSGVGLLSVTDLKTNVVYGNGIDTIHECTGAPVFNDRLYSVFIFGTDMAINIYGNRIHVPGPLHGNKFCVIVDICQNTGGTVFLMLPQESRNLLDDVEMLKDMKNNGLRFRPRGIGISLLQGVNVHYKTTFQSANLWLGTDIEYKLESKYFNLEVTGQTDVFFAVPSISSLFLDLFLEEWNGLIQFKDFTSTPTVRVPIFGKVIGITFNDMVMASLDVYLSIGDTRKVSMWSETGLDDRIWCGNGANPPGVFVTFFLDVNPFRNIPIVGDWIFRAGFRVSAFVTTEEKLSVETHIDIVNDILQTKNMVEKYRILINAFENNIIGIISGTLEDAMSQILTSISELEAILTKRLAGTSDLQYVLSDVKQLWDRYISLQEHTAVLQDGLEFHTGGFTANLSHLIESETTRIGRNIDVTISKITNKVSSMLKGYTGFGIQFTGFVSLFSLDFGTMTIELVISSKRLGQCSKFRKVYELLQGESAFRVLASTSIPIKLGYFLSFNKLRSLSIAIGDGKFVAHAKMDVSILGIKASGDVLISNNGLFVTIEGNVWNVFFARVEMSVELGRKWHDLTFSVKGKLLAASEGQGTITGRDSDFQGSYLDGLRMFARKIADEANKRITSAQNGVTMAQSALIHAQAKISNAQDNVRKFLSIFDDAINALDDAKRKVDEAKVPFENALQTLRNAKINVDNLCRIRDCPWLCMPGLRCRWCSRRSGWFRISYPCCGWTRCMFKVPNTFCETTNFFCRRIRTFAYLALEAAKIFVKIPMMILEAAKVALTIAQIAVDKARVVLGIAEGILEVAKIGLEVANGGLEIAKGAIEVIKYTVKAALYVFELIVHGIQQLIDVKNCGFEMKLSTQDKALFQVGCEVKAFGLGWTTYQFWFDFRHPVTSILRIAKATVNTLLDSVKHVLGKRKKRDISFKAMSKMHHVLKLYKRDTFDFSNNQSMYLNETIFQDENSISDSEHTAEYNDRVKYFESKCKSFKTVHEFLTLTVNNLLNISAETSASLNESTNYRNIIENITSYSSIDNMTLETSGISEEYAQSDYNLTAEELNIVLEEVKTNMLDDPVISEIANVTEVAYDMINSGIDEANSLPIISSWLFEMENLTVDYFDTNDCFDFQDCLQHTFSVLYDQFADISIEKTELSRNITVEIEDIFVKLILNDSLSTVDIYQITSHLKGNLIELSDANMFCSSPPKFDSVLQNQTFLSGDTFSLVCNVTGDPYPSIWWYYNDSLLHNETTKELKYFEPTSTHSGFYSCIAGNIVTNITSKTAYIYVTECAPGSYYLFGYCIACPLGTYTNKWNQNSCVNCPTGYTTDDERSVQDTDCYESTPMVQILVGTFVGLAIVVNAVIILVMVTRARLMKKTRDKACLTRYTKSSTESSF
ncbi:EGF-containing fibulin-like extracellular matrix protein 1,Fibrillin-1,Fibulin-1,Fibulin-2,Mucin-like protein,Fibrillin-2,Matrilin-3 [Mytilus coruscus]|uniref:EGF-containing fibulin-like extracellular matrix protein 1,Fibrillin-1,Fibulin-1,Fibulin-2,Mucin-like protein,Fibrillin-2,Matrilin-3 n=1 Tax=Mytilus coruscus TaxID=42192 RepID=A0A6J7ZVT5_MYTCO|nr:EGF-containing fibulin-like extracellular matrix protein 1,Fibrillin-1,Fibulin-1,Fibulin-2,Mucin-like protein,Fibrillin-2,Matrilin-3 [Mytilus coruscus]